MGIQIEVFPLSLSWLFNLVYLLAFSAPLSMEKVHLSGPVLPVLAKEKLRGFWNSSCPPCTPSALWGQVKNYLKRFLHKNLGCVSWRASKSPDIGMIGRAPKNTTRDKPFHSPGFCDATAETSLLQGFLGNGLPEVFSIALHAGLEKVWNR